MHLIKWLPGKPRYLALLDYLKDDWFIGLKFYIWHSFVLLSYWLREREAYLTPPPLVDNRSTQSVGSLQILVLTDDSLNWVLLLSLHCCTVWDELFWFGKDCCSS